MLAYKPFAKALRSFEVLQLMMTYYFETPKMGVPFSMMGWINHSQCVLQLIITYYVETLEMDVSILSDGVGKPFSVRPSADDQNT